MGFKTFRNGLDADVEALRENTEREWLGGEGMVDGERVGLSVNHLLGTPALASTAPYSHRTRGRREGVSRLDVTGC